MSLDKEDHMLIIKHWGKKNPGLSRILNILSTEGATGWSKLSQTPLTTELFLSKGNVN